MQTAQDKSVQAKRQKRKGKGKGGGQFVSKGGPRAVPAVIPEVDLSALSGERPADSRMQPFAAHGKEWRNAVSAYERSKWAASDDIKLALQESLQECFPDDENVVALTFSALKEAVQGIYVCSGGICSPQAYPWRGVWSSDLEFAEQAIGTAEELGEREPGKVGYVYPDYLLEEIQTSWKDSVLAIMQKNRIDGGIKDVNWMDKPGRSGAEVEIVSSAYFRRTRSGEQHEVEVVDPVLEDVEMLSSPDIEMSNDELGVKLSVTYNKLDWDDMPAHISNLHFPGSVFSDDEYKVAFVSIKTKVLDGIPEAVLSGIEKFNKDGDGPNFENAEELIDRHELTGLNDVLPFLLSL